VPHSLAVLDSVHRSNLPHSEKSAIRRFYEKLAPRASGAMSSIGHKLGMSRHVVVSGTHVLRAGGEAALVGAALGVLDAKVGLDVNVPIGAGYKAPIDGLGGLVAFGASMVPALETVSEDLNRVGVIGVASYAQRQAKQWASNAASTPVPGVSGEFGDDPVLAWAAKQ